MKIETEVLKFTYIVYRRARIDEIANSAEYRMDEELKNLPIFEIKFWFPKLEITL